MVRGRGLVPHALPIEALSLERNLANFQRSRPNTAGVIPGARHCRPGKAWIAAGPVGPGFGLAGSFFRPIPFVFSPLGVVCGPDSKLGRVRVLAGQIRVIGLGEACNFGAGWVMGWGLVPLAWPVLGEGRADQVRA